VFPGLALVWVLPFLFMMELVFLCSFCVLWFDLCVVSILISIFDGWTNVWLVTVFFVFRHCPV